MQLINHYSQEPNLLSAYDYMKQCFHAEFDYETYCKLALSNGKPVVSEQLYYGHTSLVQ